MSLEGNDDENSIKIFDDWGDIDRSLQNEINASLEKRTEISLFNGRIISKFGMSECKILDKNG